MPLSDAVLSPHLFLKKVRMMAKNWAMRHRIHALISENCNYRYPPKT